MVRPRRPASSLATIYVTTVRGGRDRVKIEADGTDAVRVTCDNLIHHVGEPFSTGWVEVQANRGRKWVAYSDITFIELVEDDA
jgi:hypothetical protein